MTVTIAVLPAVLDSHLKWLRGEAGGQKANLSGANLYGAARILVPAEAKRSHAFGRKCRAECAEVLGIFTGEGVERPEGYIGRSDFDSEFTYQKGQTVHPDSFSEDWTTECAPGIHFFITRLEAENYL